MAKTQKELAYLTDLYVSDEWTQRFTDLIDKHFDLTDSDNVAYLNAGTGSHALSLDEKFGERLDIFASCENEDVLTIARDKATAVSSKVDFSQTRFESDAFDAVIADATFVPGRDTEEFVIEAVRIARVGGEVAVLLPSAGSFGEVFSLLWEVLATDDSPETAAAVEKMIAEIPTGDELEKIAERAGLVNIRRQIVLEHFEYENGEEFITSPLVADFLLPRWLEEMDDERRESISKSLCGLIDAEDGSLTFRFSIKATLLAGEKG